MTQNKQTGRVANKFGKRMAEIVSKKIGAVRTSHSNGNEFLWNGKRITIRSAHKKNTYVGVLSSMLDRVDTVLAVIESEAEDEFKVWAIDKQTYRKNSKTQVRNPKIKQVRTKVFTEDREPMINEVIRDTGDTEIEY